MKPIPKKSLAEQLAERRVDLDIPRIAVANHLGVAKSTVRSWDLGLSSPKFRHVVSYAEYVHWRLVLRAGQQELAEGLDIIAALPRLRKTAGLTQQRMADLIHAQRPTVSSFENCGSVTAILSSVEVYAAGLRMTFGFEELAGVLVDA